MAQTSGGGQSDVRTHVDSFESWQTFASFERTHRWSTGHSFVALRWAWQLPNVQTSVDAKAPRGPRAAGASRYHASPRPGTSSQDFLAGCSPLSFWEAPVQAVSVTRKKAPVTRTEPSYDAVLTDVVGLVDAARRASARTVNALITATYWSIGRRIVEQEQYGQARADYGAALVAHLATDLSTRFGRGVGHRNLFQGRAFYLAYREIVQAVSAQSTGLPATTESADGVCTFHRDDPRRPSCRSTDLSTAMVALRAPPGCAQRGIRHTQVLNGAAHGHAGGGNPQPQHHVSRPAASERDSIRRGAAVPHP